MATYQMWEVETKSFEMAFAKLVVDWRRKGAKEVKAFLTLQIRKS